MQWLRSRPPSAHTCPPLLPVCPAPHKMWDHGLGFCPYFLIFYFILGGGLVVGGGERAGGVTPAAGGVPHDTPK